MPKTKLQKTELQDQLKKQLDLLEYYTKGREEQPNLSLPIATTLRVLCHDTKNQKSLLNQLNLKSSPCFQSTQVLESSGNKAPFCGLVYVRLNFDKAWFDPKYSNQPQGHSFTKVSFDNWWNMVIIRDYEGHQLTRKDLILEVTDRDGGAHVDSSLNETYYSISRKHSLSWTFYKNNAHSEPVTGVERASLFQIAHELLCSFKSDYECPELSKDAMLGEFSAHGQLGQSMFGKPLPFTMQMRRNPPNGKNRNLPCECGSGKKAKKCCPNGTDVRVSTNPIG